MSFSSATTISSVTLKEYANRIQGHRVEVLNGSTWTAVSSGTTVGASKSHSFTPVSTTAVRMYVTSASGQPSLYEFEVY